MTRESNPSAAVRRVTLWCLAGAAVTLSACASAPAPREQMAVTQAAVERASGPAAAEAPTELAAARDKLSRAKTAMADKNYDLARRLAEQAEADATLAEARSREARSGQALAEVRESIRLLRVELNRS
jgi:hypothetical protein